MYTLRDANQQEHGPLSAHEVRQWIANGQATRDTQARAAGEDRWRPLGQFIEFGPALDNTAAAAPPALPQSRMHRLLAIIALVLSILGFAVITAFAGIVLGIVALVLAKKRPHEFGGPRLATAAIIVGIAWLIAIPTTGFFAFRNAQRQAGIGRNCFMHANSLARSLKIVSIANGGTYPDAATWCDAIKHEVTSTNHYQCPQDPKRGICGFAYNEKLSGVRDPNPNTVMIFESDLGWNGSGGLTNAITKPRHFRHIVVGLANGQVRGIGPDQLKTLRWDP
jgi:hypothetical protein